MTDYEDNEVSYDVVNKATNEIIYSEMNTRADARTIMNQTRWIGVDYKIIKHKEKKV